MADSFDYVIVGAGSAGSVLAARLAEDGAGSVCLLEAGPPDRNPFIHVPAGFMKTLVDPKVNWLYASEPSWGTAGRRVHAPSGTTAFHLMGTCRMGPATDPSTVVNGQLKVHGLAGLQVVSASIRPAPEPAAI